MPLVTAASARRSARLAAPARGELGAAVTDLLSGAAELHAFGAVEAGLDRARAADADLTRLARRSASASGLGTGLSAAVSGLTLWGVLLLGVAATGSGSLGRVPLAVITLTALAAFEAVTALPAAAIQLGQARVAAGRIADVLDAPDPVRSPERPFPPPQRPVRISIRGGTVRYSADEPPAVRDIDLDLGPGRRVALVGATGAGKSTLAAVLFRFVDLSSGTARLNGRDLAGYDPDDVRAVISGCAAGPAHLRHDHPGQPAAGPAAGQRRRAGARPRPAPGCSTGSPRCRWAGTRRSARTAPPCPAASASGSRWPVRCWPTRPCWSWTSPPRTWTRPTAAR